jgi:hypothetical protein
MRPVREFEMRLRNSPRHGVRVGHHATSSLSPWKPEQAALNQSDREFSEGQARADATGTGARADIDFVKFIDPVPTTTS